MSDASLPKFPALGRTLTMRPEDIQKLRLSLASVAEKQKERVKQAVDELVVPEPFSDPDGDTLPLPDDTDDDDDEPYSPPNSQTPSLLPPPVLTRSATRKRVSFDVLPTAKAARIEEEVEPIEARLRAAEAQISVLRKRVESLETQFDLGDKRVLGQENNMKELIPLVYTSCYRQLSIVAHLANHDQQLANLTKLLSLLTQPNL